MPQAENELLITQKEAEEFLTKVLNDIEQEHKQKKQQPKNETTDK